MIFSNPATLTLTAQQKRIIGIFRQAGAVKSFKAIEPAEYGIPKGLMFNRLVRTGILLPIQDGRYYLNENREKELQKRRRDIISIIMMIIAIMVLLAFFWHII